MNNFPDNLSQKIECEAVISCLNLVNFCDLRP